MRTICCLLLLIGSPLALCQDTSPPLDLADPASFETKGACLAECEGVFADCKSECENTSARAHERHFETPDLPVSECIDACQADMELCKEDC